MTREQKRQYWLNHIEAWQDSDLSQIEYARRHNLSVKTFQYHKRQQSLLTSASKPAQAVVPVVVEPPTVSAVPTTSGITLSTPKGVRVELEPDFDAVCLKRLLEVLV